MSELLKIEAISKVFPLSRKQRQEKKTDAKTLCALSKLSLSLSSGEIYGLLGPNGAGKTTALRIIASLIEPSEGKVLYLDKDIQKQIENYRKHISFLTTELKLDPFFTPSFTFTYMSRLYGVSDDESEKRKEELFKRFGVDSFQNMKLGELSTGMGQKASLAIALCNNPDIIIFDEPTNGLDIISSKVVEDFLLEEKMKGKAIILSTHIFSLVEKLCSRVGILLDGKLVLEGAMKDLTASKNLEEVFFDLYEKEEKR